MEAQKKAFLCPGCLSVPCLPLSQVQSRSPLVSCVMGLWGPGGGGGGFDLVTHPLSSLLSTSCVPGPGDSGLRRVDGYVALCVVTRHQNEVLVFLRSKECLAWDLYFVTSSLGDHD